MNRQELAHILSSATADDFATDVLLGGSASFKPEVTNPYNMPEYVGSYESGKNIGIVIANLDDNIRNALDLGPQYHAIGMLSGRTGACTQVNACDVGVKSTNTIISRVELCRDSMGGAGHGCTVIFAGENVADCRRAVEISLEELENTYGDVYGCDAGHMEVHFSANAGEALVKAFGAEYGKPFGMTVGAPAAVGMVMADTALKQGDIKLIQYMDSLEVTKMTNEVNITFTGDAAAVKSAVLAARAKGLGLLSSWGQIPRSMSKPNIT